MHRSSIHIHHGGKMVHIPRKWDDAHIAAGYHEQIWGPHAEEDSDVLGYHNGLNISYSEEGVTGPEFEILFPGGSKVTVICEDVVRQYISAAAN